VFFAIFSVFSYVVKEFFVAFDTVCCRRVNILESNWLLKVSIWVRTRSNLASNRALSVLITAAAIRLHGRQSVARTCLAISCRSILIRFSPFHGRFRASCSNLSDCISVRDLIWVGYCQYFFYFYIFGALFTIGGVVCTTVCVFLHLKFAALSYVIASTRYDGIVGSGRIWSNVCTASDLEYIFTVIWDKRVLKRDW